MNPVRIRTLVAAFIVALLCSATAAAAAHAAVTFAVTNSWATGLNGEITITNDGASTQS